MIKLKITVLKRMVNQDLIDQYCERDDIAPCPVFTEGQEFTAEHHARCPEGFCSAAWHELNSGVMTLMQGGNFAGWMKNEKSFVRCCTDGFRPVVFHLECIED